MVFEISIAVLLITTGVIMVIRLNIWHRKTRAAMTPEEREQDDIDTQDQLRLW